MNKQEAFTFLDRVAKGLAETFGKSCETLVHDMSVPTHPILSIYNGHVSGRTVGSTLDILGNGQQLDENARVADLVNLCATTPEGRQVKSSTFHLRGEDYDLGLGINFDITALQFTNKMLVELMNTQADLRNVLQPTGDSRLNELFEECLAVVGKPARELNRQERLKLVNLLHQKDAFSFRKSVPFVAEQLGVSRYTVYKYMSKVMDGGELDEEEE